MSNLKKTNITLIVFLLLATFASAEVNLALQTGEIRYFAGDVFMLKLDLAINEEEGFYGDIYLVIIDTNETVFFAPKWMTRPEPVIENFFFPPSIEFESALIVEQDIPSISFPMVNDGEHTLAIGIAQAGTTNFLDIASCTTEYKGERELMTTIFDESIEFSAYQVLEDKINGGYWIDSSNNPSTGAPSLYHYKDGVIKGYGEDHFSFLSVMDMIYDSQGNFWVATNRGGIFRYDPIEDSFVNYCPPDYHPEDDPYHYENHINEFVCDGKGSIWTASLAGLCRFDIADESWTNYDEDDGMVSHGLFDIAIDRKGNIWTAGYHYIDETETTGGVSVFDGINFTNFTDIDFGILPGKLQPTKLSFDNEGCPWVAKTKSSKYLKPSRYYNGNWIPYTLDDGLPSEWINSFYLDRFGKFWASCINGDPSYLAQFKDDKWHPVLPEIKDMGVNSVNNVYQDSRNNFWFCGFYAEDDKPYGYVFCWGGD